jgi:hypothetical protein
MRLLLLIGLCALTSCQTERTVLSGPTNVQSGRSDISTESLSKERAAGEAAAASGATGQMGNGGEAFQERFGNFDPGGYLGKDEKGNTTFGLNAMSEKAFSGNLNSRDMKSFTQSKDFLTKKYGNTREVDQKTSSAQGANSWFSNKKANTGREAYGSDKSYSGSTRTIAGKTSTADGRTTPTGNAREQGRTATTGNYYPAQKVLDRGGDEPKIIGQGDKATNESIWRLIKSRPRDNPATVEEIRQLLGKSN